MPAQNRKQQTLILALAALGVMAVSAVILASCSLQQPDPQVQIDAAVAATVASIPTYTPYPIPSPYPTPVPISLNGVFCEYGFCIGHPADIYLIDDGATHNPPVPGSHSSGIIFGYSQTLFMQVIWRVSDPSYDPQTAMQTILQQGQTFQGALQATLVGKLNVFYQPTTTVTPVLPFGAAATWQCGGRDFMWKVYTAQDNLAQGLLKQALAGFRCEGT